MTSRTLPASSQDFIAERLDGLDLPSCWDVHAHVLGLGDGPSGIHMKPAKGLAKPFEAVRRKAFIHYAGCDSERVDASYLSHFGSCAGSAFPGFKSFAFAFAEYRDGDGSERLDLCDFVIPNRWARQAADDHEGLLYVPSIHPRSPDALAALEEAKLHGAVAVKWLPCAQNLDPADRAFVPFYEKLRDLRLPLITHAGAEHAVKGSAFDQGQGNPLRLRLPLSCGAVVIVAHCATDGRDVDYERSGELVPSFSLFERLMDEPEYDGLLFADISATPQVNRAKWLPLLLERERWHDKLLNGSDYPLPALPILFSLRWLRLNGLISERDLRELSKIKGANPLLFDFLLKRSLSHKGRKFSDRVFETRRAFDDSKLSGLAPARA